MCVLDMQLQVCRCDAICGTRVHTILCILCVLETLLCMVDELAELVAHWSCLVEATGHTL